MRTSVTVAREHQFKTKINEKRKEERLEISKEAKRNGKKKRENEQRVPYSGYRNS